MGLLDKLIGSDLQITRPDFDRAQSVKLNYSNVEIQLRDAPHSAISPLVDTIEELELENQNHFEARKTGDYAKSFYSRSWELKGRRGRGIGGVSARGALLYFPSFPSTGRSCFKPTDFEYEILRYCHDLWGWMNGNPEFGELGKASLIYPTSREGLEYRQINESTWCYFASQRKGQPPEVNFCKAITRQHVIVFEFKLESYGGVDFYSPETNIKETSFSVVDDFMSHVQIELPEYAKAQQEADAAEA